MARKKNGRQSVDEIRKGLAAVGGIVGTAEAAEILGVERPRIGKLKNRGAMPEPIEDLKASPVWFRADIEAMQDKIDAVRRKPRKNLCACGCGQEVGVYERTDKRRGHVKGEPREFVQGHDRKPVKA